METDSVQTVHWNLYLPWVDYLILTICNSQLKFTAVPYSLFHNTHNGYNWLATFLKEKNT